MLRLIASAGDVDSALPSYAMWHLSREVRRVAELTAAFEAGVGGLLDRLRAGGDDEAAAWLAHFERSSRTTASAARTSGTRTRTVWETRPELVLALVDRMRLAGDDAEPARPPRRRRRRP